MPRARPSITSFNAGELSPLLAGRVDQDKYFAGCEELSNFIPTVQGPARRRGGTRFVSFVKDQTKRTWLANFEFSLEQSYILEFGHLYLRFYVNRGQLLDGAAAYEIATPYTEADLVTAGGTFALRTLQPGGDIMRIVHAERKHPPYKLMRLGATEWALVQVEFDDGPWEAVGARQDGEVLSGHPLEDEVDNWIPVKFSAVTGTTTATIEFPFDLGTRLSAYPVAGDTLYVEEDGFEEIKPYQPSESVTSGDKVRAGFNVYEAQNSFAWVDGDDTLRYTPTHTRGLFNDGKVTWKYLHSGYGWGVITAVTPPLIAPGNFTYTVDVKSRIPDSALSANGGSRFFACGEFSATNGWPDSIGFFKSRAIYGRGTLLAMSEVGLHDSFAPKSAGQVTDETAIKLYLNSDKLDAVRWLAQANDLLVGAPRGEFAVGPQTPQSVFSAANADNTPHTEYGSLNIRPLRVGNGVLFVERSGCRVREMRYDYEVNRYKAEDLTVLSEHLFDGSEITGDVEQAARSVVDWAFQQQRDGVVWCVMSDGSLAALTYNRERGVIAWTPHYIGGGAFVEAVQVISSPDGSTDDVWLIVRRTVNGGLQRTVEMLLDYRLVKRGVGEAVHVDCSVTYRGGPATVISGLDHLEGQAVSICADGAKHPDRTVTGGQVVLGSAASLVHVGYRFRSRMKSMRMEVQSGAGTSQSVRKGIGEVHLRVQSTRGGRVGASFDRMDTLPLLNPTGPIGAAPTLFTGDIPITFPNGFDTEGHVCYEQEDPLPATLVAIVSRVQLND